MSPRRLLIPSLVVLALVCQAASPALAGTRAKRYRAKLFGFVNDYRVAHGRSSLRENPDLSTLAWRHSRKMAEQRRLFHTKDLGQKLRTWKVRVWGENVGVSTSIWRVFVQWRKSAPHRANMLDGRFRRAGVGIVHKRGVYWATMIFYG